jgi:UDP-N-acetylmuramoylalanine--D-glutamate ligase
MRAVVFGLGISGISACSYLLRQGYSVIACDDNPAKTLPETIAGCMVRASSSDVMQMLAKEKISLFCTSPGIPPTNPLLTLAASLGIDIVVDVELAFRSCNKLCLGITGSNGKTTVTSLVEHILQENGKDAKAVGNIEVPILDAMHHDILVVELSSFQLKRIKTAALSGACVLNITPNHLNVHPTFEDYFEAKMHIKDLVKTESMYVHESLSAHATRTYGYTEEAHVYSNGNEIVRFGKKEIVLPKPLQGIFTHDVANFLAAYALCRDVGISPEGCVSAFDSFQKPPHRIQFISTIRGVSYYDDSKATSIDAVMKALEAVPGPILLIAGGVHKGEAYTEWLSMKNKIHAIFAIGQAANLIQDDLGKEIPVTCCTNLEDATLSAVAVAKGGESVLLSPGCSSYDMYNNYKERGVHFQQIVRRLENGNQ